MEIVMDPFLNRTLGTLALGVAMMTAVLPLAHGQEASAPRSWQDANKAVAEFPRGHIDVLRWEQKNRPQPPSDSGASVTGPLSLERAIQLALRDPIEWRKPGMSAVEISEIRQKMAARRWQVQRLWVEAVASRQSVQHSRDILEVAEAGAELGRRMAEVGNWSRARQIEEELQLWDARSRLDNAELQAEHACIALWQQIGAQMTVQEVAQQLPLHLPSPWPDELSPSILENLTALQTQALKANVRWTLQDAHARRLMSGLGSLAPEQLEIFEKALRKTSVTEPPLFDPRRMRWGHALENAWQAKADADRLARQIQGDVRGAVAAYKMMRKSAQARQAEVLRLHTELAQETLLRYNGMLKSSWDLLASARTRIQSVDAALQAQRQAGLAHADLTSVLAGLPYAASLSAAGQSSGATSSNAKPGH
jgi:outer membrane protein TolC